jgi:hypothetical protein
MIDPIVQVVAGESVSNSSKMNDDIALLQQWLPVERHGEVGKRNSHYVWVLESGRGPRRGDDLVTLGSEIGNEMASNEAIGTGHEHPGLITHLSEYRCELTVARKITSLLTYFRPCAFKKSWITNLKEGIHHLLVKGVNHKPDKPPLGNQRSNGRNIFVEVSIHHRARHGPISP